MSERPFMQLYVSDYFGDTRHLSCEQHGAYLQLLMTMWNAGGSLPDDDKQLARMTCLTVKKWRGMKAVIIVFFEVVDGVLTHHRMTKELEKSASQSQSRADAGARGGAATALKFHNPPAANAAANIVAEPQHLPEPYRKRRASAHENGVLKKEAAAPPGAIWLDRFVDEALFKACEAVTGMKVHDFMQRQVFGVEIVDRARALLDQPGSAAA